MTGPHWTHPCNANLRTSTATPATSKGLKILVAQLVRAKDSRPPLKSRVPPRKIEPHHVAGAGPPLPLGRPRGELVILPLNTITQTPLFWDKKWLRKLTGIELDFLLEFAIGTGLRFRTASESRQMRKTNSYSKSNRIMCTHTYEPYIEQEKYGKCAGGWNFTVR